MDGIAWPMLNTAMAGGVMERAKGLVNTMPIGMAIASTNTLETTVSSICSHVPVRMLSEFRRLASPVVSSCPCT